MYEQDGHEDRVGPWEKVGESAGGAHGVGEEEIAGVICVASQAPPSYVC